MTDPIDPQATLATLVTERPGLAPLLETMGLDYCCGGQQTLAAAVEHAGGDLDATVAALSGAAPTATPADWAELGLTELAAHIENTHHAYLHEALPRLEALAAKVATVHGERHPELGGVHALVIALRADLEPHLAKEEHVLFPMIGVLDTATEAPTFHCGSVRNPIAVMSAEHDRAGELLAALRASTAGYEVPADGCASYRALYDGLAELEADTHLHVHKENNRLFPAAVAAEAALLGAPA